MKILHTSDWHLGRTLYGKKRYKEFEMFLDWLLIEIKNLAPDALIIAGDIFDTSTPSARAQHLYFEFLIKAQELLKKIIVIGGNHDSAALLDAPQSLLKCLKIEVVGKAKVNPSDEVIEIVNDEGELGALVCAVPYLRERDVRSSVAGESSVETYVGVNQGIKKHYSKVIEKAVEMKGVKNIPIIGTGHLFVAGGQLIDGDGVRELYVGTVEKLPLDFIPTEINYLALGHLHQSQKVNGKNHIRYSGAPLAMSFGESTQKKELLIIDFSTENLTIKTEVKALEIPVFQPLKLLKGTLPILIDELNELALKGDAIWVEAQLTEVGVEERPFEILNKVVENSCVELLRLKTPRLVENVLSHEDFQVQLEDLLPIDVFTKRLDREDVEGELAVELKTMFQSVVSELNEGSENEN